MTVSIAMCTYNGARYLQEQLDSIAAQTRLPDEMVVCDDGSQDKTISILQNFAAHTPFPVRIIVNPINLGSTQNFAQAITQCSGQIIALSDQDDVWCASKLQTLCTAFEEHPEVGLIFTDAEIVDEHLASLKTRLWPYAKFTPEKQQQLRQGQAFDLFLAYNHVTGATMAFRAMLKEVVLPIPHNIGLIHDGWIALMGAALVRVMALEMPLILYRQHTSQQMGTRPGQRPKILPQAHYQAHLHQLKVIAARLNAYKIEHGEAQTFAQQARIKRQMQHLQQRAAMPRSRWRRFWPVLHEVMSGGYHRFSNGWPSVARDLFF